MTNLEVLVVGGKGRLGRTLQFLYPEWEYVDLPECDITKPLTLKVFFKKKPQHVINCAAITDPKACENNPGLCFLVNVYGVKVLADLCLESGANLIQLSSDYVLDPHTAYAWSKVAAEAIASKANATVIRTNLYDEHMYLVAKVLEAREKGSPEKFFRVYNDVYFNPISMVGLARIMPDFLGRSGLFSLGTNKKISMAEFAMKACDVFGVPRTVVSVEPYISSAADQKRAKDTSFKSEIDVNIVADLEEFKSFLKKFNA